MNPGTFWCWLDPDYGNEEPPVVCLWRKAEAPHHGTEVADVEALMVPTFKGIFGIVPKAGEALLLNNADWAYFCPACGIQRGHKACGLYLECNAAVNAVYHPRVITRKPLSQGKPNKTMRALQNYSLRVPRSKKEKP